MDIKWENERTKNNRTIVKIIVSTNVPDSSLIETNNIVIVDIVLSNIFGTSHTTGITIETSRKWLWTYIREYVFWKNTHTLKLIMEKDTNDQQNQFW